MRVEINIVVTTKCTYTVYDKFRGLKNTKLLNVAFIVLTVFTIAWTYLMWPGTIMLEVYACLALKELCLPLA